MTNNPRCVVDTNVLISAALVKAGKPHQVVNWIVQHGVLLASEATFEEVATRLARPKFRKYLDAEDRADYLNFIHGNSRFIEITSPITECRDPKDDMFLELAVGGQADYIISGDTDLLDMHPFRGLPIVRAADFLEMALSERT